MSIDLARTLHDTVDGGAGGHADETGIGIDLATLTTRVRRRRTRRAVVRGAVGAGAAGAFAFAGVQVVGRRGPDDVLPAANPSAAPGTCGSDIGDLAVSAATSAELGLAEIAWGDGGSPNTVFGTSETDRALTVAGRELTVGLTVVAQSGSAVSGDWGLPSRAVLVTTHQGRVVSTQPALPSTTRPTWTVLSGQTQLMSSSTTLSLTTCSTAEDPGGDALPDGSYQLYVVDLAEPDAQTTVLGGGWELDLGPALPPITGLPDAFPAAEVPVVGTRLVDSFELDGVAADGWVLRTEAESAASLDSAASAIIAAGGELESTSMAAAGTGDEAGQLESITSQSIATDHWLVTVSLGWEAGVQFLRYRLQPR